MERARIFIIDDHRVVIEGIRSAMKDEKTIEIVGDTTNGLEGMEEVKILKPHMVILDIAMPEFNGLEATFKIKEMDPQIIIIIFTMYSNKEYVLDLFKAGVSAYVLKEDPIENLISAIHAVKAGGTYFSEKVRKVFLDHIRELENGKSGEVRIERLSRREREIFLFLAEGRSIRQIGEQLHISPKTVETHKYNLMEKLKVTNVIDLTKMAIRNNLIRI